MAVRIPVFALLATVLQSWLTNVSYIQVEPIELLIEKPIYISAFIPANTVIVVDAGLTILVTDAPRVLVTEVSEYETSSKTVTSICNNEWQCSSPTAVTRIAEPVLDSDPVNSALATALMPQPSATTRLEQASDMSSTTPMDAENVASLATPAPTVTSSTWGQTMEAETISSNQRPLDASSEITTIHAEGYRTTSSLESMNIGGPAILSFFNSLSSQSDNSIIASSQQSVNGAQTTGSTTRTTVLERFQSPAECDGYEVFEAPTSRAQTPYTLSVSPSSRASLTEEAIQTPSTILPSTSTIIVSHTASPVTKSSLSSYTSFVSFTPQSSESSELQSTTLKTDKTTRSSMISEASQESAHSATSSMVSSTVISSASPNTPQSSISTGASTRFRVSSLTPDLTPGSASEHKPSATTEGNSPLEVSTPASFHKPSEFPTTFDTLNTSTTPISSVAPTPTPRSESLAVYSTYSDSSAPTLESIPSSSEGISRSSTTIGPFGLSTPSQSPTSSIVITHVQFPSDTSTSTSAKTPEASESSKLPTPSLETSLAGTPSITPSSVTEPLKTSTPLESPTTSDLNTPSESASAAEPGTTGLETPTQSETSVKGAETPAPAPGCVSGADCGDNDNEICDLTTGTCVPSIPDQSCSNGGLNYAMYENPFYNEDMVEYSNFDVSYFKTATPFFQGATDRVGIKQGLNPYWPPIKVYDDSPEEFLQYKAIDHWALLYAPYTGDYEISVPVSDEITLVWVGDEALAGWTRENADVEQHYDYATRPPVAVRIRLEAGTYNPIRILWANGQGVFEFILSIIAPNGDIIVDGTQSNTEYLVRFACTGQVSV